MTTAQDLRALADQADEHGNKWVPITPAVLREIADMLEPAKPKPSVYPYPAFGNAANPYAGAGKQPEFRLSTRPDGTPFLKAIE